MAMDKGLPSAGLFAGPVAWMVSTQGNYALTSFSCGGRPYAVPLLALALIAASLFGGFLSWRGLSAASSAPTPDPTGGGRPHRFVAIIGVLTAVLFALVIAVHGAAGFVFNGCER